MIDDDAAVPCEALDAFDDSVARLIRARLHARLHERIRSHLGVTVEQAQLYVLRTLGDCGAIRPGELAELCGVDQSTMTRQIQQLERRGLIVRVADPADGRAHIVELSAYGREVNGRLHQTRRVLLRQALASWSAVDVERFTALASRLASDLDRVRQAPPDG